MTSFFESLEPEVAEEIEAAFTRGADLRRLNQFAQLRHGLVRKFVGVVRMNAGRGAEHRRIRAHDGDGRPRALERAAGDDHVADARPEGSGDDLVAIAVEAVVAEVQADVYQRRRHAISGSGILRGLAPQGRGADGIVATSASRRRS